MIFVAVKYKSVQITTQNLECLIIKMQTFMVFYTLLTYSSVFVPAGLQEAFNVAKYRADIHQELPNSSVFIMKSERVEQGEKYFIYIHVRMLRCK